MTYFVSLLVCEPIAAERLFGESARVFTLDSCHSWCKRALEQVKASGAITWHNLQKLLAERVITTSTAFSGIGAPETADEIIAKTAAGFLQEHASEDDGHDGEEAVPLEPLEFLPKHACEWYSKSQTVLLAQPGSDACLFGDILSFVPADKRDAWKKATNADERMVEFNKMANGPIEREQDCLRHNKKCNICVTSKHTAGTPCQDFSSLGSRKQTCGPRMVFFFAWVALVRNLLFPVLVHENVPEFGIDLLVQTLGDLYVMIRILLDSKHFGLPMARPRQYTICLLKSMLDPHLRSVMPPLLCSFEKNQKLLMHASAGMDFSAFMVATDEELEAERQWALKRPLVIDKMNEEETEDDGSFFIALTPGELERWEGYKQIRLGQCCDLGANPFKRPTSSKHGRLQTFVKGSGLLFFDVTSQNKSQPNVGPRWMLPLEMLEAMGFPITESSQAASYGAAHAYSRGQPVLSDQSRASMSGQAGNSMAVVAVGSVSLLLVLQLTIDRRRVQPESAFGQTFARRVLRKVSSAESK